MNVFYNNKEITDGEFISPQKSQLRPIVDYNDSLDTFFTLILHDPDAPAGNHLHWVVINIPGNNINAGNTLLEYVGPAPEGSGIHRYIFLLLEQNEKKYPKTLERIMSMNDLYDKINIRNLPKVAETYFTSRNQSAGKKKKRVKTRTLRKSKKNKKTKKNKQTKKRSARKTFLQ